MRLSRDDRNSRTASKIPADGVELLGNDGPFARHITGFEPRPQQQKMAAAVREALADAKVLVVEAGTGTGKTFAYLAPALLSGLKVIISTGTRNLQDQLYQKDLPLVCRALELPVKTALLKGRANYLCRQRLQYSIASGLLKNRRLIAELMQIRDWGGRTRSGDIAEVADVPEGSSIWPRITSTTDNCLGQDCPHFNDCFVVKARRRALEADLVVINHHLLCADMVIRDEGFGEILPEGDAFIIDEAHQLPEVAGQFFGQSLSSHQLQDLAREIEAEQQREAPDFSTLAEHARQLDAMVERWRLAFGTDSQRGAWQQIAAVTVVSEATAELQETLGLLLPVLAEASVRGSGLEHCSERAQRLSQLLQSFVENSGEDLIYWFETRPRSVSLHQTPLEVSRAFATHRQRYPGAWVFTSATLAVGEDFSHFTERLGLDDPCTLRMESPFDYARNALLYHPRDLPEPNASNYTQALLQAALPVLAASRGRAFLLFTGHQALREAADYLAERIDYPLLIQGNLPKTALLQRFRTLGNAVLLGTASFWEGVDVRGEALSCVVIAKLPFSSPGDPVMQARIDALRHRGGNPFMHYQLPQAVIALKQGVGRLIRDGHDRGVLMLGDPRLLSRSYGRVFLDSLPPMARTRGLQRVQAFFATLDSPPSVSATG